MTHLSAQPLPPRDWHFLHHQHLASAKSWRGQHRAERSTQAFKKSEREYVTDNTKNQLHSDQPCLPTPLVNDYRVMLKMTERERLRACLCIRHVCVLIISSAWAIFSQHKHWSQASPLNLNTAYPTHLCGGPMINKVNGDLEMKETVAWGSRIGLVAGMYKGQVSHTVVSL